MAKAASIIAPLRPNRREAAPRSARSGPSCRRRGACPVSMTLDPRRRSNMRHSRIALAAAALAFTLTAGLAEAAQKSRRSANPQDNMADQLNAQSLSRAQAGTDSP